MLLAVAVLALAALLATAFRHPRGYVEGGIALAGVALCLVTRAISPHSAGRAALEILPVVLFLVAILVVCGGCAERGLFDAVGSRLGGRSPTVFLTSCFVAGVAVTAVLSLDATALLFTLVVVAAAQQARTDPWPGLFSAVRMANSSSLLLPISNLTTLLILRRIDLSPGRFALVMLPVWLVVIATEYVVARILFRHTLRGGPLEHREPLPVPWLPVVVLAAMVLAAMLLPLAGLPADWSAAIAAGAAALVVHRRNPASDLHTGFAMWILSLSVVVAAVVDHGAGHLVRQLIPSGEGLVALLGIAVLATVLANLVNNLPATLVLGPLLAGAGPLPLLAALIGLNVGAGLTWTGSLANLLWRRTLTRAELRPTSARFHRVSLVATPLSLVAGVVTLWLTRSLV